MYLLRIEKGRGNQESLKTRALPSIVAPMVDGGEGRFPATRRLKKRSDFKRIHHHGKAIEGTYFTLQILPMVGRSRLGITIPRGWGNAVQRNRIKRLIREAFRRHGEIFSGMDTIVRPHGACKGRRAEEIEQSLVEEVRAAVGMEVERGKGNSLPDERGIHSDAAGA